MPDLHLIALSDGYACIDAYSPAGVAFLSTIPGFAHRAGYPDRLLDVAEAIVMVMNGALDQGLRIRGN